MRSELATVEGTIDIETNLDEQTVKIIVDPSFELEVVLNDLATKNDKIEDWSIED